MLVHTSSSPTSKMRSKILPRGCLTRSDTILVSSRNRISKIDRLCRRIFDRRKILIERLERCKNCQERSGRRRLDNESLSFFSDNCVLSRQLEFARNSYRLISPILEKFDVSLSHCYHMAYAVPYVKPWREPSSSDRGL